MCLHAVCCVLWSNNNSLDKLLEKVQRQLESEKIERERLEKEAADSQARAAQAKEEVDSVQSAVKEKERALQLAREKAAELGAQAHSIALAKEKELEEPQHNLT